jgi:hypothetical protein
MAGLFDRGAASANDASLTDATRTSDDQRALDRLYDGNKAETPDAGAAQAFYGHSLLKGAIDRRGPELWAETGATQQQQQELRDTFVGIAQRTGLPELLLATIAESHIDHQLADVRPVDDTDAAAQALETQTQEWNVATRAELQNLYGVTEAERLLERTQRFVRGHPVLAKVLRERGLGSRPDVVLGLAAHVFSSGYR